MIKNEVFLLKGNAWFVFDRRNNRLFRIANGRRLEIRDRDYIGNIVISTAEVFPIEPGYSSDEEATARGEVKNDTD